MASIHKTEEEQRLIDICNAELAPRQLRVVDLDCHLGGKSFVRVFIDNASLDNGSSLDADGKRSVSIGDCVEVTHLLRPVFDKEPWLRDSYELEVSSPGLERRLRLTEDFARSIGEELAIDFVEPHHGHKRLQATLTGMVENLAFVEQQGVTFELPIQNIKRATKVWHFAQKHS